MRCCPDVYIIFTSQTWHFSVTSALTPYNHRPKKGGQTEESCCDLQSDCKQRGTFIPHQELAKANCCFSVCVRQFKSFFFPVPWTGPQWTAEPPLSAHSWYPVLLNNKCSSWSHSWLSSLCCPYSIRHMHTSVPSHTHTHIPSQCYFFTASSVGRKKKKKCSTDWQQSRKNTEEEKRSWLFQMEEGDREVTK